MAKNEKTSVKDDELKEALLNQPVMIYEEVQGSRFFVNWNGFKWTFKAKSLSNHELTQFDLMVQKYWTAAVDYFLKMKPGLTKLLNKNWWFCFEYFPDETPAHVSYDYKPKSGLVLTHIVKESGKLWTQHLPELYEYSKLLNCDILPVIFYGNLGKKQAELISRYLKTSPEDLHYIFGEDNFTQFFYSILAPKEESSFLMDKDKYNSNIEKLKLKFYGDSQKWRAFSIDLLNPFYKRQAKDTSTQYLTVYSMILLSFMESISAVSIRDIKLSGNSNMSCYIELMSQLYKMHVARTNSNPEEWEFDLPKFYTKEKHRLDLSRIKDKELLKTVENSKKKEYVLKTVFNAFTRPMKKPLGIFTEATVKEFNRLSREINEAIESHLGVKRMKVRDVKTVTNTGVQALDPAYVAADRRIHLPKTDIDRDEEGDNKAKKKGNIFKLGKDSIF